MAPFWAFERVSDESQANLIPVLYRVQLVGGADVVSSTPEDLSQQRRFVRAGAQPKASGPPASPRAPDASGEYAPHSLAVRAIASSAEAQAEAVERFVHIPVLVNRVPLQAGAELKVALRAKVARPKRTTAIAVTTLAKKAKLL